ncbi:MAG: glucoamylase family protein, partial [Gracilimonas sp.]
MKNNCRNFFPIFNKMIAVVLPVLLLSVSAYSYQSKYTHSSTSSQLQSQKTTLVHQSDLDSQITNDTSKTYYGVPASFVEELKSNTFDYFWEVVDTATWQTDDRYPTRNFTSIAATGFAIPAYIIGIHNEYVSREEGSERVLNVLEWLWNAPQGADAESITGHRGFFYHFLNYESGTRYKQVELSTIDTGLLIAGVLTAQSYFDGNYPVEKRIRNLADSLYLRVEWDWAMNDNPTMSMGWHPESGFIKAQWKGYNEAMILLILAMGSPEHPIPDNSWDVWTST